MEQHVKVITGIRRCEKSTLLFDLFGDYLLNTLKVDASSVDVGAVPIRDKNNKEYIEIDFIVNNLDQKIYIQSALKIEDQDKNESETKPLKLTNDSFKKILIRNDVVENFYDEKGIYNCRLLDFLLERVHI